MARTWSDDRVLFAVQSTDGGARAHTAPPATLAGVASNWSGAELGWPESPTENRLSILGVLRLRAVGPLLSDRPARRFAQDDNSVGELTNGDLWWEPGALQVPPLRRRFGRDDNSVARERPQKAARRMAVNLGPTELSSRPERSAVEGPAVSLLVLAIRIAQDSRGIPPCAVQRA